LKKIDLANVAVTNGDAKAIADKDNRMPRANFEAWGMERDRNGVSYSVFRFRVDEYGNAAVSCTLDGATYSVARQNVLTHMVISNTQAVERESKQ